MDAVFLNSKPPTPGTPAAYAHAMEKTNETAKGFESMFMSQMMQFMWTDTEANEIFGGGQAEGIWKGMFIQEVGTMSGQDGKLGIADAVKSELIKIQEEHGMLPASHPVQHKTFDMKEMTQ